MGYQAENGTWRDFYLSGAKELRDGITAAQTPATASPDTERAMSDEMLFDFLGVRLNGPQAAAVHLTFNVTFADTEKTYRLEVANGVLNYFAAEASDTADTSIALKRADLDDIMMGTATFTDKLSSGAVQVDGDVAAFQTFLGLLDSFDFWFNIVTP